MLKYQALLWCFLLFSSTTSGQVLSSASIGLNGLSCSQCSRGVEMALRQLPFVSEVDMDLEHTQGVVYFKKGRNIDWRALAQAPRNAGFATRFVKLRLAASELSSDETCFTFQRKAFYFLSPLSKSPSDTVMEFQVIAKGFLPDKEWKQYTLSPDTSCPAAEQYYLKAVER